MNQSVLHLWTGWASKTQANQVPMILPQQYQVNEDIAQAICELNHEQQIWTPTLKWWNQKIKWSRIQVIWWYYSSALWEIPYIGTLFAWYTIRDFFTIKPSFHSCCTRDHWESQGRRDRGVYKYKPQIFINFIKWLSITTLSLALYIIMFISWVDSCQNWDQHSLWTYHDICRPFGIQTYKILHCRCDCVPQVKATHINQILDALYFLLKTSLLLWEGSCGTNT